MLPYADVCALCSESALPAADEADVFADTAVMSFPSEALLRVADTSLWTRIPDDVGGDDHSWFV